MTSGSFRRSDYNTKKRALALALMILLDMVWSSPPTIRKSPKDIPTGSLSNGNCRLVFSEINLYPTGSQQFIEISKTCQSRGSRVDVNMEAKDGDSTGSSYKIVILSHTGYLLVVCELKGHAKASTSGDVFYTIGGEKYDSGNINMKIGDCDVAEDYEDFVAKNRFPSGEVYPVGIGLIFNKSPRTLKTIALEKKDHKTLKVKISDAIQKKLLENLQDFVIVSSSSPYTHCKFFSRFYDGYNMNIKEYYLVRDWAQPEGPYDYSQSRCDPTSDSSPDFWFPFKPSHFYYAPSSPNKPNQCGQKIRYIVEETQAQRSDAVKDADKASDFDCITTTVDVAITMLGVISNPVQYADRLKALIDAATRSEGAGALHVMGNPLDDEGLPSCFSEAEGCSTEDSAWTAPARLPQEQYELQLASSSPHIWASCDRFEPKSLLRDLQSQKNPFLHPTDLVNKEVCFWFEFLVPTKKFRCKLCHSLLTQGLVMDRPGSKIINLIMTSGIGYNNDDGSRPWSKTANSALIRKHLTNPIHAISLDYFRIFDSGKRGNDLMSEFERDGGPFRSYLEKTEVHFVNVFQCVRLDIPFLKYEITVETLKYFGVDPGFLYLNPEGYRLILSSISETLHSDFVSKLKSERPVLSVMIDTSTDRGSLASLTIVFHLFDSMNAVSVKLYRIIQCTKDETGDEMFKLFMNSIKEDGLEEYVKSECVGFSSDGGKNVGRFKNHLNAFTTRQLATVHCMAHRLQLAIKKAWKQIPFLREIDQLINYLYQLFNSRSAKKKIYLREAASENGERGFEAKRIIYTRWIASKARAMNTVYNHWSSFVKAVQGVSVDPSFTQKQRDDAKAALALLTDPVVISTIAFVGDVCDVLATLSLQLQTKGSTIIGKRAKREQMEEKLHRLEEDDGPKLHDLISKATPINPSEKIESLTDFENKKVKLGDHVLHAPTLHTSQNRLSSARKSYLEPLLDQVFAYFPQDVTDGFNIFDPNEWPKSSLESFGNTEIVAICVALKWDFPEADLVKDWNDVKKNVAAHPNFSLQKERTPEEFWGYYLASADIPWPGSIRTIINNVLTIQSSTAEVERVYSLYTHSKTPQRYSLTVASVENIVRVKYNGPRSLSDFDATHYVKRFISKHSRSDDGSRPTERSKRPIAEEPAAEEELQESKRPRTDNQLNEDDFALAIDLSEDLFVEEFEEDDHLIF